MVEGPSSLSTHRQPVGGSDVIVGGSVDIGVTIDTGVSPVGRVKVSPGRESVNVGTGTSVLDT